MPNNRVSTQEETPPFGLTRLRCETCEGSGYQGYDDATIYRKRLHKFVNEFRHATARMKPENLPDTSQFNLPTVAHLAQYKQKAVKK